MKRSSITMIHDLLVLVLNHMLFMVISITGLGIFGKENPNIGLWIATGLLSIALFFARVHISNRLLFYGIHAAILWATWMLPLEQVVKVFLLGNTIIYVILSVRNKMISKTGKTALIHPAFFFVVTAILSLWEMFVRNNQWEVIYIRMTFCYLIFYIIYFFVQQYLCFVESNEKNASNIPEQEMFLSGIKQTAVFAVGSSVILWISLNLDWFSKMMRKVGEWIVNMLRAFFSMFDFGVIEEVEKPLPDKMEVHTNGIGEAILPEFVLEIIAKIATIIAVVGVIAFVVFVVVVIYRFLRKYFQKVEKEKKIVLNTIGDIREQCKISEKKRERNLFVGFLNNRDKVRKLFRKTIVKQKSQIIGTLSEEQLRFVTAKECCEKIQAEGLKQIYEKARYSDEEITAEDVRKAKA